MLEKKLSSRISDVLVMGGIIKDTDRDKCSYGIDIMFSSVMQLLLILIISVFIGNIVETLLFFLMFIPLRIYAGGYHADSRGRCFIILVCVYIIFCFLVEIESERLYAVMICVGLVFSMFMVLITAPVLHSRKHLTKNEINVFRKIAILICCSETIIVLVGMFTVGPNKYVLSCECGQIAVSLSMLLACIKKHLGGCKV